jgi:hypothetical protein
MPYTTRFRLVPPRLKIVLLLALLAGLAASVAPTARAASGTVILSHSDPAGGQPGGRAGDTFGQPVRQPAG